MRKLLFIVTIFFAFHSSVNATYAHNIYSSPDLKGNRGFDTYMIDFAGIKTPDNTYWALCNWQMNLDEFKKAHPNASGGWAYAGFQVRGSKKSIMSFWNVSYDNTILRARMIYPDSGSQLFTGEGEGVHYLNDYNWQTSNWYRMVIHSWENYTTHTTNVGQWIYDYSNAKWDLITIFDTNLPKSYLDGNMSFFQENFNPSTALDIREFNIKGMYARSYSNKTWVSLDSTYLSYDDDSYGYDTAGTHDFGVSGNAFYGSAGGSVSNQSLYDQSRPIRQKYSVSQNSVPTIPSITPTITDVSGTSSTTIKWNYSGPQKLFGIKIYNKDTNERLFEVESINPIARQATFDIPYSNDYKYTVFITDIFDVTTSVTTPNGNYKTGDFSGNGIFDSQDIVLYRKYLAGVSTAVSTYESYSNNPEKINSIDLDHNHVINLVDLVGARLLIAND